MCDGIKLHVLFRVSAAARVRISYARIVVLLSAVIKGLSVQHVFPFKAVIKLSASRPPLNVHRC